MKDIDKIKKLKENYNDIKIPENLNDVVNDAINSKHRNKRIHKKWIVAAASVCVVIGAVNTNKSFAQSLEEIPVIGSVIKIINFSNYQIKEDGYEASIKVPKI